MPRKTIAVEDVKARMNEALQMSPSSYREGREAIATVLSGFLHDTGNYAGFAYVDMSGERVSKERIDRGAYDETRRQYF